MVIKLRAPNEDTWSKCKSIICCYCHVVHVLSNPLYLGSTLDDSRVHQIEQQIRVSNL